MRLPGVISKRALSDGVQYPTMGTTTLLWSSRPLQRCSISLGGIQPRTAGAVTLPLFGFMVLTYTWLARAWICTARPGTFWLLVISLVLCSSHIWGSNTGPLSSQIVTHLGFNGVKSTRDDQARQPGSNVPDIYKCSIFLHSVGASYFTAFAVENLVCTADVPKAYAFLWDQGNRIHYSSLYNFGTNVRNEWICIKYSTV